MGKNLRRFLCAVVSAFLCAFSYLPVSAEGKDSSNEYFIIVKFNSGDPTSSPILLSEIDEKNHVSLSLGTKFGDTIDAIVTEKSPSKRLLVLKYTIGRSITKKQILAKRKKLDKDVWAARGQMKCMKVLKTDGRAERTYRGCIVTVVASSPFEPDLEESALGEIRSE